MLFECHCIWHESTNRGQERMICLVGDTIFYERRDRHFTWLSEPREGPTACGAKGVPSFLSDFETLRIGIEPATSRSAVKRSTDWANPAARKYFPGCDFNTQICKEALKSRFKSSQLDFSFQFSELLKVSRYNETSKTQYWRYFSTCHWRHSYGLEHTSKTS